MRLPDISDDFMMFVLVLTFDMLRLRVGLRVARGVLHA